MPQTPQSIVCRLFAEAVEEAGRQFDHLDGEDAWQQLLVVYAVSAATSICATLGGPEAATAELDIEQLSDEELRTMCAGLGHALDTTAIPILRCIVTRFASKLREETANLAEGFRAFEAYFFRDREGNVSVRFTDTQGKKTAWRNLNADELEFVRGLHDEVNV